MSTDKTAKYRGIKKQGTDNNGNWGDIWYWDEGSRLYKCDEKNYKITEYQLLSDLQKGYIEKIEEEEYGKEK